jgi:dihydropteroate synthase
MSEVLAGYKPGHILGHAPEPPRTMQNAPQYGDVVEEVYAFFAKRLETLAAAGLPPENVVLDVGMGFGKSLAHNLALLRHMGRFHSLGCPVCLGISRKRFFGDLLGLPGGQARDAATQTLTALMAARGVQIHRVHDVKGAVAALRLLQEIIYA